MNEITVGRVVFSKMGRDKGRYYLVTKIPEKNYAHIADGDTRKIEKPKKKKFIHIKATNTVLENLKEKLEQGKIIHNKELLSALRAFNANGEGEKNG